jgi:regulator of protease activity HflC (stomatin/prohibitin superfamily)
VFYRHPGGNVGVVDFFGTVSEKTLTPGIPLVNPMAKVVKFSCQEIILTPRLRSISRAVTASFQASALYSTERERLGELIPTELANVVGPRGIIVESTPLRNVALPPQLTEAIEQRQRADQESQRMEFIVAKERQEAERKRIEARGIAEFQTIVSKGISDQLLRWKGVEATEKLANSPNTKVIILWSGKDGLPVILDTE